MLIVYIVAFVIGYFLIAAVTSYLLKKYYKEEMEDDTCVDAGLLWPITLILFILVAVPLETYDFIRKFLYNNFSNEAKERKRSESRKLVEEILNEGKNGY